MIIHYEDGTSVILHLGDLDHKTQNNDICWVKIAETDPWIRSPFDSIAKSRDYLLSKQSSTQLKLDDAGHPAK